MRGQIHVARCYDVVNPNMHRADFRGSRGRLAIKKQQPVAESPLIGTYSYDSRHQPAPVQRIYTFLRTCALMHQLYLDGLW